MRAAVARCALAALLLAGATGPVRHAGADDTSAGGLHEVGRLPLSAEGFSDGGVLPRTGWLVLNPTTRRGYQFLTDENATIVQSFDLDTLALRRRVSFEGYALVGASAGTGAITNGRAGDVLHAVDERHGRVYFALHDTGTPGSAVEFSKDLLATQETATADGQVATSRLVALDERALDEGRAEFASSFDLPNPADQATWLRSLAVLPGTGEAPGRLLALWTPPHTLASVVTSVPTVAHQVVVYDVSGLAFRADAPRSLPTATTPGAREVSRQVVRECANASMRHLPGLAGVYQWEVLLRPEGLYVVCQTSQGSAKVALVPMGPDGTAPPGAQPRSFLLSRGVSDVLADTAGGRLLLKSHGAAGVTWWVFDAPTQRFRGSVAVVLAEGLIQAGLDPATGRLYTAFPDYVLYSGGRSAPLEGGLFSADTRLDPVPAKEPRDPALARFGVFRISVDPATRRVFFRLGGEPFYRVLRDDRPRAAAPPAQDDRRYTVDTEEAEGVTKASYLGSGSSYGARLVLTGGLAAATAREAGGGRCGQQDRELVVGQVASAVLSDLSSSATAASLAGDADTEEQAGKPVARCGPEQLEPVLKGDPDTDDDDIDVEVTELAFDKDPDTHPGSDYRVQCVGGGDPAEAGRSPRAGFSATVDCGAERRVEGNATGGAYLRVGGDHPEARDVWVGWSHSETEVYHRPNGGVVTRVEAIARDVEIEGLGRIGVVRAEAVAEAAGTNRSARGRFERSICGVDLTAVQLTRAGCLSEDDQQLLVAAFNRAFSGRAEMRLREPDPKLFAGSPSGYSAAVQRDRLELFEDAVISRDKSLTVPGLEIVSFRGDHVDYGPGRQILQLAGVQAGTSYGIACLHGQSPAGDCRRAADDSGLVVEDGPDVPQPPTDDGDTADSEERDGQPAGFDSGLAGTGPGGDEDEHPLTRLLRLPVRVAAEVLRLLFSSPRELGLLASVWGLMYAACRLGERRRTVRALRSVRLTTSGGAR